MLNQAVVQKELSRKNFSHYAPLSAEPKGHLLTFQRKDQQARHESHVAPWQRDDHWTSVCSILAVMHVGNEG